MIILMESGLGTYTMPSGVFPNADTYERWLWTYKLLLVDPESRNVKNYAWQKSSSIFAQNSVPGGRPYVTHFSLEDVISLMRGEYLVRNNT